jgi:hypothetical protein
MANLILESCGLESRPRWIELDYNGAWSKVICSNCGEPIKVNNRHIPTECPKCKEKMKGG